MDITPVLGESYQIIESYGDSGFVIARQSYSGAVLVVPEATRVFPVSTFSMLVDEDFKSLLEILPAAEIVLIGCGKTQQFLPLPLRNMLRQHGLTADVMDTGAACRTFNVLLSEGRRVAALLFPCA